MKARHMQGLGQDLAQQTKEAKKMGGPSDKLKSVMRRPEGAPTSYFNGVMNYDEGQWEKIFKKKKYED